LLYTFKGMEGSSNNVPALSRPRKFGLSWGFAEISTR